MSTPATYRSKLTPIVLSCVATVLCALPIRAQYVSTLITNLSGPAGVAIDSSNNVYISDPGNHRIAKYVPSSAALTTLAGSSQNQGANNGTGSAASFVIPQGMVAARGGLIVADQGSHLIRYVTFGGTVTNIAGQPFVSGSVNAKGTNALFSYPVGVAVDSLGDIYVTEPNKGDIRKIDLNNNVTTVPTGGYAFSLPSAVALDGNDNVWVADSGHHVICLINNGVVTVMAGISGHAGTNDSVTATSAQFNYPKGLLWVGGSQSFLISDSANDTVRNLFLTNIDGVISYAVQTVGGLAGLPGSANGTLSVAQFNAPLGLCLDPTDFGYYVADSQNNVVRVLQATAPLPPIAAPQIGYVSFSTVNGNQAATFNNITGSSVIFNNTNFIEIEADPTTQTYMNFGVTGSAISPPGPNSGPNPTPTIYTSADNGETPTQIPASVIPFMSNVTIYAISEAPGRPSSPQVSVIIQYVTATPEISGVDSASILLTDGTTNAQMWYTLDGTAPAQFGAGSLGPVTNGTVLSFPVYSNTTLSVRAYYPGFAQSSVVSNVFTPANYSADKLTWGFQQGEASSAFIAAAGQRFYAPITLSLIPTGETMYTLQFDMVVTNLNGSPPAQPGTFQSMLMQKVSGSTFYEPIPAPIFAQPGYPYVNTNSIGPAYTLITNASIGLLGVAWVERPPATNLYPTTSQTLISYSIAHDTLFTSGGGSVVVGGYSFVVPMTASNGDTYRLDLSNPSATSDGITTPVLIQTVTNGSMTNGPINSVKDVTVGSFHYLVGDAAPFHWFNAGDFGDGSLENDDVTEVFQSAVYGLNSPPAGSDFFDAMDSSNGATNNLYDSIDTSINAITSGDGVLSVDDVYVTLRRSLDPTLTNYNRFWSNGVRQAVAVPTTASPTGPGSIPAPLVLPSSARYMTVSASQVQTGGGLTAQVPIRVVAGDSSYPIRVAMLHVEIDPLDGSPPITSTVSFSAAGSLGSPYASMSQTANDFAGAWLNSSVSGVSGTNLIGTLNVTLPSNVTSNSAYVVHFDHFSASPNGLALFHSAVNDGLITVGNRSTSSWHDGIPDSWRLLHFGSVSNSFSAANADPDGDGASNWQEYIAGTDPLSATSVFKFSPAVVPGGNSFTLQWPSVVNKLYSVQCSSSPASGWTTVASQIPGNGQTLLWTDTNASGGQRFYRALVQ